MREPFFRGVLGIQMKISCSLIMPVGIVGVLVTSRLTQSTCFMFLQNVYTISFDNVPGIYLYVGIFVKKKF